MPQEHSCVPAWALSGLGRGGRWESRLALGNRRRAGPRRLCGWGAQAEELTTSPEPLLLFIDEHLSVERQHVPGRRGAAAWPSMPAPTHSGSFLFGGACRALGVCPAGCLSEPRSLGAGGAEKGTGLQGAGHSLLERSLGSPRRRKAPGVLEEEVGVWNSRGGGKDKHLLPLYMP